jgi:hypothetical protein
MEISRQYTPFFAIKPANLRHKNAFSCDVSFISTSHCAQKIKAFKDLSMKKAK